VRLGATALALLFLVGPVAAQDPGRVYFRDSSCGYRGPLVNPAQQTRVIFTSSEGTAWATNNTFVTLANWLNVEQTIRVRIKPDGKALQEWTFVLAPNGGRGALWVNYELSRRGVTGDVNFATLVLCGSVCTAEMITWDLAYVDARPRSMVPGCEGPIILNPYF
jgi:hypothetical protein